MNSPLGLLAALLLGLGFTLAVLVPPESVSGPLVAVLPTFLLAIGGALTLLLSAARNCSGAGMIALLLPLVALPGMLLHSHGAIATGAHFAALAVAAVALRCFVAEGANARALLRTMLAVLAVTALIGLAQTLYQRDEARAYVAANPDAFSNSAMANAFLASDRCASVFLVPNTFAAVLWLLLPLVVGACWVARDSPRLRAAAPALLLLSAFAAAASLGAFAAGGCAVWCSVQRWRSPARKATLLALAALSFCAALLLCWPAARALLGSATHSAIDLKLLSLHERVDFQTLAMRLFTDWSPLGLGFGAFADCAEAVLRPGEAWSASPHAAWLQLLLEGGLAPLTALMIAVVWLGRATRSTTPLECAPVPAAALRPASAPLLRANAGHSARAFLLGAAMALALVPFVVPLATPLPLSMDIPAAASAALLVAFGVLWWLLAAAAQLPQARPLLSLGLLAFFIHGFVDSDLFIPGAAAAALFVATLLLPLPQRSAARTLQVAAAVLALAIAALAVHSAWRADLRRVALDLAAEDAGARQFLATNHDGALDALEQAGPTLAVHGTAAVDAALGALPQLLRDSPRGRVLEARLLVAAATARRASLTEVRRRVAVLAQPDDRRQSEILHLQAQVARMGGDAAAQASFEQRAATAAARWPQR